MYRIYLSITLILSVLTVNSQGFVFSTEEELNSLEQLTNQTFGFTTDIPIRYSFEAYVPNVAEQEGGTCVGYAMLYYALSTMYNIEFGITDNRGKLAHAFDPYYIYTILNNDKSDPCDQGLRMYEATETLQNIGAKKLLYPPYLSCGTRWTKSKLMPVLDYTLPYAISDFISIDMNQPNLVELAKGALYYNLPIISAFFITESLYPRSSSNPNGVDNFGLWSPNELEESIGGHAMTIVGYDDYKYGGAFRVVNSWGTEYADEGYIWITYKDWLEYAKESYILELNKNIASASGDFKIYQDDYVRYEKNNTTYEGETSLNYAFDGMGIFYEPSDDTYYIGNYKQNQLNGYTLYIDSDGLFSSNVVNGVFQNVNQLGFSGAPDFEETNDSINSYLKQVGIKYKIRKANSTKRFSPKIEN